MKTILFIDWENFKKKLEAALNTGNKANKPDWYEYNFTGLFKQVLQGIKVDRSIFYAAKLSYCNSTPIKSNELIKKQRLLKSYLEKQGFEFVYGGRVREITDSSKRISFREKGVDVQIAVDMMSMACDNELKTAILASSDSDLQPAIKNLGKRNVECIYLGFELEPNKGLTYTTKRTILIRNSEVINFLPQKII